MKYFSFLKFRFTLQQYLLLMVILGIALTCFATIYERELYKNHLSDNPVARAHRWLRDTDLYLKDPSKMPEDTDEADIRIVRAAAYTYLQQYDEAMKEFEKGRQSRKDAYWYKHGIGRLIALLESYKRYKEVDRIFETMITDYPDHQEHVRSYTNFLITVPDPALRNPEKAAQLVKKYIDELPYPPRREEYILQATVFAEIGKFDEAKNAARRALALEPTVLRNLEDENENLRDMIEKIEKAQQPPLSSSPK